jgi:hypothetical protein
MTPHRSLQDGDVVEVEGIGSLRNRMIAAAEGTR